MEVKKRNELCNVYRRVRRKEGGMGCLCVCEREFV